MGRTLEARELISGLVMGGVEPVEISLESMQGQVDILDPSDFTATVHSSLASTEYRSLLSEQVEQTLSCLSRREITVLRMRFGLEDGKSRTLKQAGEAIGKSKTTAWRVEREALQKLRHPSKVQPLQDYLAGL